MSTQQEREEHEKTSRACESERGVFARVYVCDCVFCDDYTFLTQGTNPTDQSARRRSPTNSKSILRQDVTESLAVERGVGISRGHETAGRQKEMAVGENSVQRPRTGSAKKLGYRSHLLNEFSWREQLIDTYHKTGQERSTEMRGGARRGWWALVDSAARVSTDVHGELLEGWKWTKTSVMHTRTHARMHARERTYITHTHTFNAHTSRIQTHLTHPLGERTYITHTHTFNEHTSRIRTNITCTHYARKRTHITHTHTFNKYTF